MKKIYKIAVFALIVAIVLTSVMVYSINLTANSVNKYEEKYTEVNKAREGYKFVPHTDFVPNTGFAKQIGTYFVWFLDLVVVPFSLFYVVVDNIYNRQLRKLKKGEGNE